MSELQMTGDPLVELETLGKRLAPIVAREITKEIRRLQPNLVGGYA